MKIDKKNFINNEQGQLTIVGILMMFLVLMLLSHFMPTIIGTVNQMSANLTASSYTTEAALIKLTPLFYVVVFLATLGMYAGPQVR